MLTINGIKRHFEAGSVDSDVASLNPLDKQTLLCIPTVSQEAAANYGVHSAIFVIAHTTLGGVGQRKLWRLWFPLLLQGPHCARHTDST